MLSCCDFEITIISFCALDVNSVEVECNTISPSTSDAAQFHRSVLGRGTDLERREMGENEPKNEKGKLIMGHISDIKIRKEINPRRTSRKENREE